MRRLGLKKQLLDFIAAHPDAPTNEVAVALNCHPAYVRATARRNGLEIPHSGPENGHAISRPLEGRKVPQELYQKLRPAAIRREISVVDLVLQIATVVARDGVVDVVLGDRQGADLQ